MFINEVEHIVGLSKKSIRFYEENGLLSPVRRKDNDYRVYSKDDINQLKKIKFLRELGVSIKDLKALINKELNLQDCINERLISISLEEEKYEKIKNICLELIASEEEFENLNFKRHFENMNILNKEGFTMRDLKTSKRKKIIGAIIASLIFGLLIMLVPLIITYFQFTESEKIPWFIYFIVMAIFMLPLSGIVYNLITRIIEIKGGEEDEASKY